MLVSLMDWKAKLIWPSGYARPALADPDVFAQVYAELGAVAWPDEIDLAPDAMHDEIKKNGVWSLK